MKKLLIISSLTIIVLAGIWFYFASNYPDTSPLKSVQFYIEKIINPRPNLKKETFGFLPYWRVNETKNIKLQYISHVDYFGLVVDADGEFIQETNTETEPGYREWQTQKVKDFMTKAQIFGSKTSLSIISHVNSTTEALLDHPQAQDKLIANILKEVKTRKLDGINIDFEYLGDADPEYKAKFSEFSRNLKEELTKQNPDSKLYLSVMPYSVRSDDILDLVKLEPIYDRFIGMSYDFYGISSEIAGPIAPLTGYKENKYYFDVATMYEDLTKQIPKEKILMGVAHYGWDWTVEDGETIQSPTFPSDHENNYAAVMSYARAQTDENINPENCSWDEFAFETWCWYTDTDGVDHQVWLADNKTIKSRYDFAKSNDFTGIAIWVLGYEGENSSIWGLMKDGFGRN